MVIAIAIVAVGILAAFGGDLIGTASVVETMDLSKQNLYASQEFVSVTIKNSGTTAIGGIHAYLLIDDMSDCGVGSYKARISTVDLAGSATLVGIDLNPGDSATINGDLHTTGDYEIDSGTVEGPSIDIACTNTNAIDDRQEYIIQVDGLSEGGDVISTTTTVRAR